VFDGLALTATGTVLPSLLAVPASGIEVQVIMQPDINIVSDLPTRAIDLASPNWIVDGFADIVDLPKRTDEDAEAYDDSQHSRRRRGNHCN